MSEDTTQPKTHGDMVKNTAESLRNLLVNVGNYIDFLEKQVATLQQRVSDLERSQDDLK